MKCLFWQEKRLRRRYAGQEKECMPVVENYEKQSIFMQKQCHSIHMQYY